MTVSSESLPRVRGVQFREGASNWVDTPFLQATTFEHEHEHEHEHERRTPNAEREAPGEGYATKVQYRINVSVLTFG